MLDQCELRPGAGAPCGDAHDLCKLQKGDAGSAGCAVDKDGLGGADLREALEHLDGDEIVQRRCRRDGEIGSCGSRDQTVCGNANALGVGAGAHDCDHGLTGAEGLYSCADSFYRSAERIAGHIGRLRCTGDDASAVIDVSARDAREMDADQSFPRCRLDRIEGVELHHFRAAVGDDANLTRVCSSHRRQSFPDAEFYFAGAHISARQRLARAFRTFV